MKRIIWLAALLAAAALGSELFHASDVAKLQPVEVLRVECLGQGFRVETDTGEVGAGEDLAEAFANLKAVTAGDIFLDTVEYVLLPEGQPQLSGELAAYLRPACRVCLEKGRAELSQVGKFLDVHPPEPTLMDCQGELPPLPVLITEEGRMELVS